MGGGRGRRGAARRRSAVPLPAGHGATGRHAYAPPLAPPADTLPQVPGAELLASGKAPQLRARPRLAAPPVRREVVGAPPPRLRGPLEARGVAPVHSVPRRGSGRPRSARAPPGSALRSPGLSTPRLPLTPPGRAGQPECLTLNSKQLSRRSVSATGTVCRSAFCSVFLYWTRPKGRRHVESSQKRDGWDFLPDPLHPRKIPVLFGWTLYGAIGGV